MKAASSIIISDIITPIRFGLKAFSSDKTRTVSPEIVTFNCLVENNSETTTFKWYQNGTVITGATTAALNWTAPATSGIYTIKCEVTSNYKTITSSEIEITVAPQGEVAPKINSFSIPGTEPYSNCRFNKCRSYDNPFNGNL